MIRLLVPLALFLTRTLTAADWPGAKFSEIRAYYYNAASEHDRRIVDREGKLDSTVTNRAGIKLTESQVVRLLGLVRTSAAPQPVTACYVPHHAFIVYSSWGRRIAVFEFCLECLKATPQPNTTGPFYDFPALADLLHDVGLPIGPKFRSPAEYRAFFKRTVSATR